MLKTTIKSIMDARGAKCFESPRIINELADLDAFSDCIASKYVLKTLIQEGYVSKIRSYSGGGAYICADAEKLIDEMVLKFGFRRDISVYVINAFLFALGLSEITDINTSNSNTMRSGNEAESHIRFSGISLVHPINEIEKHLLTRGFKTVRSMPYQIKMVGTFCEIDNVDLYINGSPRGVTKSVILQIKSIATSLYVNWSNELYKLLSNKYGQPSEVFDPLCTIENDFDHYCKEVLSYADRVKNYDEIIRYKWTVIGGYIELCWIGDHMNLSYKDTPNTELAERYQKQFNEESI